MRNLASFQNILGVSFKDPALLEHALVHSSYVNENPDSEFSSNERMEFLGDAVLGLITAETLFQQFPNLSEGQMTRLRSALVSRDALYGMAKELKLGDYLNFGRGEESGGGRRRPANLAAAMEAVIAAVYLDGGLEAAREFIVRLLTPELEKVVGGISIDYKSRLQEWFQAREGRRPSYHVLAATGPDHAPSFIVEVRIGDRILGRGKGKSKKAAESEAAAAALNSLSI